MTALVLAEGSPLTHVIQHRLWVEPLPLHLPFCDQFTVLSNHTIMQLLAAALLVLIVPRVLRRRVGHDGFDRLVPKGLGNAIEGLCEALRGQVARPALGRYTDRFMPYLWSAFFFVLTSNILGLIPLTSWFVPLAKAIEHVPPHALGGTSTGNIMVTAALAISTLGMIIINGLRIHGWAYVRHFFMGPPGLNAFIALLEVVGLLAKTFALAMRLFANMIAGHVLLAVLLSFIGMAWNGMGAGGGLLISVPVIVGSIAINFLELFVAFLQAFIFTFLSAMFIGQAVNIEHVQAHGGHEEAAPAAAPVRA